MAYIGYPSAFLFPEPKQASTRRSVEHWPWGYFVRTLGEERNGFVKVRHRSKTKTGETRVHAWIRASDLQTDRLLEVNFVDIGQGDGCFVVMPDDSRMLIDAGETDNMYRFLRWRFNHKQVHIHDAVMTHPDKDHYFGFGALVADEKFSFGNVYHNGIVERADKKQPLGARVKLQGSRKSVLTDVIETPEQLDALLESAKQRGRKLYPNLLKAMRDSGRVEAIWMLHHEDLFVPGYEDDKDVTLAVLGPVPERVGDRLRLPWFGGVGETKNGHSVVFRLTYGGVSMLLGGDLNIPAEHYLLEHYTGRDPKPKTIDDHEQLISAARRTFGSDLMKACHHGSADFSEEFIEAVDPLAVVISSGDSEPHAHPRPDALGAFGKYSRGRRPCIFSTELARSAREHVGLPDALRGRADELVRLLASAGATAAAKQDAQKELAVLLQRRERAVAVYGMITARTDGQRMIVTQKLEERRSSTGERWDIHRFEPGADGRLRYVAKH